MSDSDRPEPLADDGVVFDATPACTALVPMAGPAPFSRPWSRPDSPFVAQLIATAEQLPQTRQLRRATPADALTAYGASRYPARGAGIRTRQII